ncbi:MAG: hypothetical protein SVG88_03710 [Halobacteriales archaeon]|nr:hypothetical protein [Halobacteriales archaeon]
MAFDMTRTAIAFVAIIAIGTLGLLGMGFMATRTVLMMVLPAMVVFGLITLWIGVQYGEYRATQA